MNEEEKESIEEFRKQLRLAINIDDVTTTIRNDNAQTILNLIEKLQKENKELNKLHIQDNKHLDFIMEHSISIQKIKDKIEEIKQEKKKYGNCLIEMYEDELVNRDIKILQELIEGRKENV